MTKIIAYHVRDDEVPFIREWEADHHVAVKIVKDELHDNNVDLAEGFDGLVYKQRSALSTSDALYQKLHSWGIKQLACRSAGIDTINFQAAKDNDLKITNVPSYSPPAVAELVLAHAMQLIRHLPEYRARYQENNYVVNGLRARELSELTIGIIGVGRIGSTVAKIFTALGAKVVGYDIVEHDDYRPFVEYLSSQEAVLKRADVVTLHVYLSEQTTHLIDQTAFQTMKPTAYLINASRGPVVENQALINALEQRQIAGAAIDVYDGETKIFNYQFEDEIEDANYRKLESMPNVVLSPHVGFFTDIAVENMVKQSLNDALTIINGGTSPHEIVL